MKIYDYFSKFFSCVKLGFKQYYLWLKYSILTPSFFFKNRFFIDKTSRINYVYSNPSNTQKSFTWIKFNSTVLSTFWFQLSHKRLSLYIISILLILLSLSIKDNYYIFYIFSNSFTPLYYIFWRVLDVFYFFLLQLQYLIIISLISLLFSISNFIASTNFNIVNWMKKYHAEVPLQYEIKDPNLEFLTNLNLLHFQNLSKNKMKNTKTIKISDHSLLDVNLLYFLKSFYNLQYFNTFPLINLNDSINLKQNKNHQNELFLPSILFKKQNKIFITNTLNSQSTIIKLKEQSINEIYINFFKLMKWVSNFSIINKFDIRILERFSFFDLNINLKNSYEWLNFRNNNIINTIGIRLNLTPSINSYNKFSHQPNLFNLINFYNIHNLSELQTTLFLTKLDFKLINLNNLIIDNQISKSLINFIDPIFIIFNSNSLKRFKLNQNYTVDLSTRSLISTYKKFLY